MKKLKKILLEDVEILKDSEMKNLKGSFGRSGNGCPTHGSVSDCTATVACFAEGEKGRCRTLLFTYGTIPYAQLGYMCVCDLNG